MFSPLAPKNTGLMQAAILDTAPRNRPLATKGDYEVCRRLHREFGTTYYFSSRHLPLRQRRQVDALYGFVRVPDEWVDNPGSRSKEATALLLKDYRDALTAAQKGVMPCHSVLRAFSDVMSELDMTLDEPMVFLDAMEMDLTRTRYQTWEDLLGYMRGSAAAVGIMMSRVIGAPQTPEAIGAAEALGNAMQLTNFLRDIGEDLERGRIYMPLDDLASFGLGEKDLLARQVTPAFVEFMKFEIGRARGLFAESDKGIELIPSSCRLGVKLGRVLYSRILDKIEERGYDVFSGRARTTQWEKASTAVRLVVSARSSLR